MFSGSAGIRRLRFAAIECFFCRALNLGVFFSPNFRLKTGKRIILLFLKVVFYLSKITVTFTKSNI